MKIKMLTILMILCVWMCGCSDERLSQPLEVAFFGEDVEALPAGVVGPPPPHIWNILWGDMEDDLDWTLNVLLEYEEWKARGEGEEFRPVVVAHLEQGIVRQMMAQKYYTKYIDAGGVAILGNDYIEDHYFYAAREMVLGMTSKRPELRTHLTLSHEDRLNPHPGGTIDVPHRRFRYILFHVNQGGAAIPERYPKNPVAIGWCHRVMCVSPVDRYIKSDGTVVKHIASIFVHEFAHAIHLAIRMIDPTFDARLREAYEAVANDEESYFGGGGAAALENPREYWAFSADKWFLGFSIPDHNGAARQHARFREKDPLMYALLEEWFDFTYLGHVETKVYE